VAQETISLRCLQTIGLLPALISILVAGCVPTEAPDPEEAGATEEGYDVFVSDTDHYRIRLVPVADGLSYPYALAFLEGGDILVTEMNGQVRLIREGVLDPDPVGVVPGVHYVGGSGGLMDIALHPDFEENRFVYFTYNKPGDRGSTNAIARGRFDGVRLTDITDVFVADAWGTRDGNFSSRMAFAFDGSLYLAVSHHGLPDSAQDPSDHLGKLLRLADDGSVPPDNPFVGQSGYRPEIFTVGHRNFHGVAIDPETGSVWTQEHGDEVNVHRAGANHGWPYTGVGGEGGGQPTGNPPAGLELTEPLIGMNPSIGTHGLMFYTGDVFPAWRGSILIGGSRTLGISRFEIDADGLTVREDLFANFDRVRDVRQGPDGLVYFVTDGDPGTVMRIEPIRN
jgi:glucose/arabinose dehydrogenase